MERQLNSTAQTNGFELLFTNQDNLKNLYIICFELKGLRRVNAVCGREAVDRAMQNMCDWFTAMLAEGEGFYRISGDMFMLKLMKEHMAQIDEVVAQIQYRFRQPWGEHVFFDANIGFIDVGDAGISPADLQNIIDEIIDEAGKQGKVIYYDQKSVEDYRLRILIELSLRNAVRDNMDGFSVRYQPICNSATGLWSGFEALCRWRCQPAGDVEPGVFIPLAERSGIIGDIDIWVMRQAVEQMKKWGIDEQDFLLLNVNISSNLMSNGNTADKVREVLEENGFPANKLCIEITNAKRLEYNTEVIKTIADLSSLGVLLAIDEFGTDFVSLANLKYLPINALKLDRSFLQDICVNASLKYLVQIIVELAHEANMIVFAEKVETEIEMETLADCGVDRLQGKLFYEPGNATEIEKDLNKFVNSPTVFKAARSNIDAQALPQLDNELDILKVMLAQVRLPIFLSDPETDEIVFANKEFCTVYKQNNMRGKHCYEVMHSKSERCEFCHVPELVNEVADFTTWDKYVDIAGKYLRVTDTLVEGLNGKKFHMQYGYDVTTITEYQQKLEEYVMLDIPTNTLNRNALLDKLNVMVYEMVSENRPLSLCFIDLDGLKKTNDIYGHAEGDLLIVHTVEAVRDVIRRGDIIGRYGGDEFIVIFPNCRKETVDRRINRAQRLLADIAWAGSDERPYSFSYGIAEISEMEADSAVLQIAQRLIQLADERMYEQKIANKMQRE